MYLEDDAWTALHLRSRESGLSISELVRRAVRERYLSPAVQRKDAMRALVGIWKDRSDIADTDAHVRDLREGRRPERLAR